ncbi:MAG: hypothetical protein K0Q72_5471 [Armatimonadetes bacterium]|nr:hypothetical protein [Armatimonadota bacterium]
MVPGVRSSMGWLGGLLGLVLPAAGVAGGSTHPAPAKISFNRDIRPVLAAKCFACHGPDAAHRKGDLRLDLERAAHEAAVVPGKPDASSLIARITAKGALQMPPASTGKALSGAEVALLRAWISQGGRYEAHWSYLPPRRPAPPAVRRAAWVRNPIDRFILARVEAGGLAPSAEADRVTLIRRLSFDLTGLPPTPAEVDAFLRDQSPSAYEQVVDRLLASPRFGERMAVYWLDLVRYADTVGYHGDQEHHISPYRDWVIKAFNDDLPFDRFTAEQLAGDLLVDEALGKRRATPKPAAPDLAALTQLPGPLQQKLVATGYNRVLQTTHEGGAQDREYLAKYAADRVRNLGMVWMGATTGCVECHDHKYDPYSQKDFYSLAAFFADVDERGAFKGPDANPTVRPPELDVLSPFDQEALDRLRPAIEKLQALKQQRPLSEVEAKDLAALEQRLGEVSRRKLKSMITVSVPPRATRILRRGDWMDDGGDLVQPALPHFLPSGIEAPAPGSRLDRLDLARWLTRPDHPQTGRVFVNRMWYLLFGTGLCRSLDDTGSFPAAGDISPVPQYPAAGDISPVPHFPAAGDISPKPWSVKGLMRLIVTSAAYRQSSLVTPELQRKDPENRLFSRQGRFRLPAEMIRDNALAVSGLLVERLGGPSAHPYQPEGYYSLLNFPRRTYPEDRNENQYRRGVYVHWQRQYLHPMLRAFDAPSREECTAQRPITNTPLAALTLLNDPSFVEAARVLAARALREGGPDEATRLQWVWRTVLSRPAAARETASLQRLLQRSRDHYRQDLPAARELLGTGMAPTPPGLDPVDLASWIAVARALLNLSETITRN